MLPRTHRITRADDFRRTIRAGIKATGPSVIVYGVLTAGAQADNPPRVGVTVSKAVGGSVVRHRVARVIRHAMAEEISILPAGSSWVIRALPQAASTESVARDVHAGVWAVLTKAEGQRR
jgi:ribonuclease P protein component